MTEECEPITVHKEILARLSKAGYRRYLGCGNGLPEATTVSDKVMMKAAPLLTVGMVWGGLCPDTLGEVARSLAQLMPPLGKSCVILRLRCGQAGDDCQKFTLEITELG